MKTKFLKTLLLFSVILILSCSDNDDNETTIIGTWKLSAQLLDPGDGSGTYQTISSNRTITFYDNGTYSSNGSFCTINAGSFENTTGNYSYTDSEKSLTPNCTYTVDKLNIKIENGELVMTNFSCDESCAQKYVKLNN